MKPQQIKLHNTYATRAGSELKVIRIAKNRVTYLRPESLMPNEPFETDLALFAQQVEKVVIKYYPIGRIREKRTYDLRNGQRVRVLYMFLDDDADQALTYAYVRGAFKDKQVETKLATFAKTILRRAE